MDNVSNNKRIAKNTVFMYLRMFVTLGLGLYTSRAVLHALGAEDYGLYNVIGGIIAMFSFVNGAMTNTTSRFITFYLGKNDAEELNMIFSMSFLIHLFIALLIGILGETVGLWYLYEKLVVPEGRFEAAFWLYQLSILSSVLSILIVPFNATIVAHEKMSAFAYISIIEAILKCAIAVCIAFSPYDKLIVYGILMFMVTVSIMTIYFTYCKRYFAEVGIRWYWNRPVFSEMFKFTGWGLLGSFSYVFYSQGINLILNAFCGTAVNAARGIAVQVEGVVRSFASNVQTAINPQIIKSYAENELSRMFSLVYASSRYCFFLLFLLCLPLIIEAEYVMRIWLVEVPNHTINFVRIVLVSVLLDALSNPLFTTNLATGKVRIYNFTLSCISFILMPITYLSMRYTLIPESVFICLFCCKLAEQIARLFIARQQVGLSIGTYFKKVILPIIFVVVSAPVIPSVLFLSMPVNIWTVILVTSVSVLSVLSMVYLMGITPNERKFVCEFVRTKIRPFIKQTSNREYE